MVTPRQSICSVLLLLSCAHATPEEPAPPVPTLESAVDATVKITNPRKGRGSGFAWDAHTVVTAHHIVAGAVAPPVVETRTGETCETLGVFSTDAEDISLVFVKGCTLTPIHRGAPPAELGDEVWAVGHPFGFSWSVSRGVVSAVRDGFTFADLPPATYLQIDAAVNSGSSGGPITTPLGSLIGIVIGAASRNGPGSVGVNFALPLSAVEHTVKAFERLGQQPDAE